MPHIPGWPQFHNKPKIVYIKDLNHGAFYTATSAEGPSSPHLLVPHRQSVDPSDAVSRDADADTLTFTGTFLAALSAPKHVPDLQVSRSNYLMGNICQFSHSCCEGGRRSISGVSLSFVGITSIRGYFPQGYFVLVGRAGHCKPNMCGALCSTRIIQQTLNICLFTRPSDNE